jgi:hypothetical protein
MDPERYMADTTGIDPDTLLDGWQWFFGNRHFTVFRVTAMGDLFLQDMAGRFHFLDMIGGKLSTFAGTERELWSKLADRSTRKIALCTFVVRGLEEAGIVLRPGECYSPINPPILGGSLSNDNLRPTPLVVHSVRMGDVHRQARVPRPASGEQFE